METEVLYNPKWSVPLSKFPKGVFSSVFWKWSAIEFAAWIPELFSFAELLFMKFQSYAIAGKTIGGNFPRFGISNRVSLTDFFFSLLYTFSLFLPPVKHNKCLTKKLYHFWLAIPKIRNCQNWDYTHVLIFPSLYLDFAIVFKYGYIFLEFCIKDIHTVSFFLYYCDYFRGIPVYGRPLGVTSVQLSTPLTKTCNVKEANSVIGSFGILV